MNEIIIDLNADNVIFVDEQIIHQDELKKAKEIIKESLRTLGNGKPKDIHFDQSLAFNNTILIEGTRGSGKTSFLQSLMKDCFESKELAFLKLEILPLLDPTMVEEKAHIFLTIISMIKNVVERKIDSFDGNTNLGKRKDWEDRLIKLSKGLPVIDGVSEKKPDYWDDASQIMYKGLEDVDSAFNLRSNFNDFINESLFLLEKDAFLLVIDDVDTDFNRAWPVLEMLRKYICTNKIISIVSGDYNLFSYAVRKKQWKNFGESLLINEYDKYTNNDSKKYPVQVNDLENQYLKKILPVENRINLHSIYELISGGKDIQIIPLNKSTKIEIKDFYTEVLKPFGIRNVSQRQAYIRFIESLPIRTQIQLMKVLGNNNYDIMNTFITELYYYNISINLLSDNKVFLIITILRFLAENDELFNYYQLEPISDSIIKNACLLTFSLLLSESIKGDSLQLFNYIIKIGYVRNLIPYFDNKIADDNKRVGIKDLINYSSLYNENDLHQISSKIISYMRSVIGKDSKSFAGTLVLSGFAAKAKEKHANSFDTIVKGIQNPLLKQIACLPLSVTSFEKKTATVNEYSFFTLLAGIYEIVNEFRQIDENKRKTELPEIISKVSQIRKYPGFDYISNNPIGENEENIVPVITLEEINSEDRKQFFQVYEAWFNTSSSNGIVVSSYVLGKICTRSMVAFDEIIIASGKKTLGEIMHLFICAFFNACIIEEMQDVLADIIPEVSKDNVPKISRDNVLSGEDKLKSNLKAIVNLLEENKLPVTRFFITCPFLLVFIDNNSGIWEQLKGFIDINRIKELQIYSDLCKIAIKDLTANNKSNDTKIEFREWNSEQIFNKLKEEHYPLQAFMDKASDALRKDIKGYFGKCSRMTKNFEYHLNKLRMKLKGQNSY